MINWLVRHRLIVANLSLIAILLIGGSYLLFGALRLNPFDSTYNVTVKFSQSGGVQAISDVAVRGVRVGKVKSINISPDSGTIDVTVSIKDNYKIARNNLTVEVLPLSAAGEQYIDFRPVTSEGPTLRNGDIIRPAAANCSDDNCSDGQTDPSQGVSSVNASFPQLLDNALGTVNSLEPAKLQELVGTLNEAIVPPGETGNDVDNQQLAVLLDSAGVIAGKVYENLPTLTSLIRNAGEIFRVSKDLGPDLRSLTSGAVRLTDGLRDSTAEINELLGPGAQRVSSLSSAVIQMQDPLTSLLKRVRDITEQSALRAPTLAVLFPAVRDGLTNVKNFFHDGALYAYVSAFYPEPYCPYAQTPVSPTKIMPWSVPTNQYCTTADKTQQIRGSANAPRPKGDDTAGPPPGYNPNQMSVPLKVVKFK